MKTKKELEQVKEEVEKMNRKFAELSEEELTQVSGGAIGRMDNVFEGRIDNYSIKTIDSALQKCLDQEA